MVAFGPAKVFFPSKRVPISSILNFISDFIIVVDKDFKIVQVNENFLNLFEIKLDSVLGNKIGNLLNIFSKIPEIIPNIKNALEGKESLIETSFKNKTDEMYFRIRNIPTTLDNGEPGVGLIIEDITKQKNAEDKMLQAIKEWKTTFNAITEMISIHDKDFNIVKINKAMADFLENKPEKIIGKKCYEVLHGTNKPYPNCPCQQTKLTKKSVSFEFFEPYLGKHIEITVNPIIDEAGEITGSVNVFKEINS
jgi:PAS domain S-box-containing protein